MRERGKGEEKRDRINSFLDFLSFSISNLLEFFNEESICSLGVVVLLRQQLLTDVALCCAPYDASYQHKSVLYFPFRKRREEKK